MSTGRAQKADAGAEARDARSAWRSRWIRAAIFLAIVYALAGPKLIEKWETYRIARERREQVRNPVRQTPDGNRVAPGSVMRAEVVDDKIRWHQVPGPDLILNHSDELGLSDEQRVRIGQMAAEARERQERLSEQAAEVRSRLSAGERGQPMSQDDLVRRTDELAGLDGERIRAEEQAFAAARLLLDEDQRARLDRMTETPGGESDRG